MEEARHLTRWEIVASSRNLLDLVELALEQYQGYELSLSTGMVESPQTLLFLVLQDPVTRIINSMRHSRS